MKNKNLLITALIVGALVLVAGLDTWNASKTKKNDLSSRKIVKFDGSQINEIQFLRQDKEVLLQRGIDGWEIIKPIQVPADNEFMGDFLLQVVDENAIEVAAEAKKIDFEIYGLKEPLAKYRFKNSLGESVSVAISAESNFEGHHFVRINEEQRVLVVASTWYERAQKGVLDFRDRRFLKEKIASIFKIQVSNAHSKFTFVENNGIWTLENKKNVLDQNKVRAFLKGLIDARASDFEVEGDIVAKSDLSKWGLKFPTSVLKLYLKDKVWTAEVGQNTAKKVFAKTSSPQAILLMESGAIDDVLRFTEDDFKEDKKIEKHGDVK